MLRLHEAAVLVLLLVAVVVVILNYDQLPEPMAAHFDAGGAADGWMSRAAFFRVTGAALLLSAAIAVLAPRLLRRLPEALINLPHKAHWLAPERREATWTALENRLGAVGAGVVALLVLVLDAVIRAQRMPQPHLGAGRTWGLLAAFLVYTAACTVSLWRRFARTDGRPGPTPGV